MKDLQTMAMDLGLASNVVKLDTGLGKASPGISSSTTDITIYMKRMLQHNKNSSAVCQDRLAQQVGCRADLP